MHKGLKKRSATRTQEYACAWKDSAVSVVTTVPQDTGVILIFKLVVVMRKARHRPFVMQLETVLV